MNRILMLFALMCAITTLKSQNPCDRCDNWQMPSVGGNHFQNSIYVPQIEEHGTLLGFRIFSIDSSLLELKDRDGNDLTNKSGKWQFNWNVAHQPNRWQPIQKGCEPRCKMPDNFEGVIELRVWYFSCDDRIRADEYNAPKKQFFKATNRFTVPLGAWNAIPTKRSKQ